MAFQRIGLSQEAAFFMTNTLQLVTHYINTAFGLPKETYFPTKIFLQDKRQGNGTEPTVRVIISAILQTIVRDQGFGLDVVSCFSQLAL